MVGTPHIGMGSPADLPGGKGDIEQFSGPFGVLVEQLVEIPIR